MLLRSATDRLTARVLEPTGRSSGCRLDAYRIDDTLFVDIELPGVDPAGIDVAVDRTGLTVRAQRKPAGDESGGAAGPVSRQITLPDALDTDRLDARYDNGVLTLSIPAEVSA